MAQFEDKVLHELDGIKEYDNPMPGWLMAIWWGSLIFSAAYLIFYALSFGEGSMEAEYRGETQTGPRRRPGALRRAPARRRRRPPSSSPARTTPRCSTPVRRASPGRAPRATARRRRG